MKNKTKIFSGKFIAGLLIYALLFLILAGAGLSVFWKYIEAYELSRPKNTVAEFVDQLTEEQMCAASDELYDSCRDLQTRDQFDQAIRNALSGELSYAKKSSESTEDRQVYALRSGRTVIGSFVIEAGEEDRFGFRRWAVTDSQFDFSFLMGEAITLTVPSEFCVLVNDVALDGSYIVESGIQYSALEEFYGDYTLPTMVSYTITGYLGDVEVQVLNESGNPVSIADDMDMNQFLPQCSDAQAKAVEEFADEFVELWVKFSGSTNATKGGNYSRLKKVLSSDGALSERLYSALDGLTFGQSNGASIQQITVNRIVPMEADTYMCDLTYMVRTTGRQGAVDTTSNMKLIMVTENGKLRVKAMERY